MKFGEHLTESKLDEAVFCFGRYQPPTIGHEKLFERVSFASNSPRNAFMFGSNSFGGPDNPLKPRRKLELLKKMFPRFSRNFVIDNEIRTFINAASWLYKKGYNSIVMVAGSDRLNKFDNLLNRYNNLKQSNGDIYHFESINVISSGERDPESKSASTSISGSKMREYARLDNFEMFKKGLPGRLSDNEIKKLMQEIGGR